MSHADQAAIDFQNILELGDLTEAIEYQEWSSTGALAWRAIEAIVDRGDALEPTVMGLPGRRGPQALMVSVAKHPTIGVAVPRERQDRIRLGGGTPQAREYLVERIVRADDPGRWALYATP